MALEDLLAARTRDARAAEGYARSLEAALAEAQGAREGRDNARELEAELAKINGPTREP